MSLGYGGSARIELQDEKTVMYSYMAYDLNDPKYRNSHREYDGLITISKDALPAAKPQRSRKSVSLDLDCAQLFSCGAITVDNSRFCWKFTSDGVGMIANRIVFKLLRIYQEEGQLPSVVGYHV